jgi:hypothetical protein
VAADCHERPVEQVSTAHVVVPELKRWFGTGRQLGIVENSATTDSDHRPPLLAPPAEMAIGTLIPLTKW